MRARGRFLALSLSFLFLLSAVSAQPNSSSQESGKQVLAELDKATWISDVTWNPENSSQVKVVIHSEIPKPVSIQEIPDYNSKSGNFQPMKQITLNAGENTVYVDVNGRSNLGISLTDSNNGVYYKQGARPLIGDINRADFYGFGIIVAVSVILQILARGKVSDILLGRNPGEIA